VPLTVRGFDGHRWEVRAGRLVPPGVGGPAPAGTRVWVRLHFSVKTGRWRESPLISRVRTVQWIEVMDLADVTEWTKVWEGHRDDG